MVHYVAQVWTETVNLIRLKVSFYIIAKLLLNTFFKRRSVLSHTCLTCSDLPSNISSMIHIYLRDSFYPSFLIGRIRFRFRIRLQRASKSSNQDRGAADPCGFDPDPSLEKIRIRTQKVRIRNPASNRLYIE